jgi:hypothetical protein
MVIISEEGIKSNYLPLKMEAAGICKEKFFTHEIGGRMFLRNVYQTTQHHILEENSHHSYLC